MKKSLLFMLFCLFIGFGANAQKNIRVNLGEEYIQSNPSDLEAKQMLETYKLNYKAWKVGPKDKNSNVFIKKQTAALDKYFSKVSPAYASGLRND